MALHLNLLHEEITEQRQRQRDPLKLGTMTLGVIGALMLLYYIFKAYQTLQIKSRSRRCERDWAKVEPQVTAAQKRSAELTATLERRECWTNTSNAAFSGRRSWRKSFPMRRAEHPTDQHEGTVSEDKRSSVS